MLFAITFGRVFAVGGVVPKWGRYKGARTIYALPYGTHKQLADAIDSGEIKMVVHGAPEHNGYNWRHVVCSGHRLYPRMPAGDDPKTIDELVHSAFLDFSDEGLCACGKQTYWHFPHYGITEDATQAVWASCGSFSCGGTGIPMHPAVFAVVMQKGEHRWPTKMSLISMNYKIGFNILDLVEKLPKKRQSRAR